METVTIRIAELPGLFRESLRAALDAGGLCIATGPELARLLQEPRLTKIDDGILEALLGVVANNVAQACVFVEEERAL